MVLIVFLCILFFWSYNYPKTMPPFFISGNILVATKIFSHLIEKIDLGAFQYPKGCKRRDGPRSPAGNKRVSLSDINLQFKVYRRSASFFGNIES